MKSHLNITKGLLALIMVVGMQEIHATPATDTLQRIQENRGDKKALAEALPILRFYKTNKYERILLTTLRDKNTSTKEYRAATKKIAALLVNKVVRCLPSKEVEIETPIGKCLGEAFSQKVELVSIMRSGDALLDTFINHFSDAAVSKVLVQRDEETAKPHFIYQKLSNTLASGNFVVITEPMIGTGGTLDMVISHLKEEGVQEDKIIIASVIAAPEGLVELNKRYPKIKVVLTALDERLNDKNYITPGLGDFGDRFFGNK